MYLSLHSRARGRSILRLTGLWLALTASVLASQLSALDVSSRVEVLGRPSAKGPFANNPWDLQFFNGQIYCGFGDTNANAGAGPILSYDPQTEQFVVGSFTPPEEQIGIFRIIDGQLVIPGRDPRDQVARIYRLEGSTWKSYPLLTGAFHVFDCVKFGTNWFAGLGVAYNTTSPYIPLKAPLCRGTDVTALKTIPLEAGQGSCLYRVYRLFEVGGKLYGSCNATGVAGGYTPPPFVSYDAASSTFLVTGNPTRAQAYPGASAALQPLLRVERPTPYGQTLLYIGAREIPEWRGEYLYKANDLANATRISLAAGESPWDILVRGTRAYVLTNTRLATNPDRFLIKVIASDDLTTWTDVMSFAQDTFARSFEEVDGDFYFGLGTDAGTTADITAAETYTTILNNLSGTILRVRKTASEFVARAPAPTFNPRSWNLSGLIAPGLTVTIYDNGLVIGTAKATSSGGWTWKPVSPFAAGTHRFTITTTSTSLTSLPSVGTVATIITPTITAQPQNTSVTVGQTATFRVAASGTTPLTYQWKLGTTIVGTNSATLSITNAQAANAGSYTCVVSNSAGAATSTAAILTVTVSQAQASSVGPGASASGCGNGAGIGLAALIFSALCFRRRDRD